MLEDRLPEWLKWSPVSLVWVAIVGILFWMQSFQKIHYTDIWGHVEYGRLLWETGKIPATEPLMPLSAGMPFVDTAWGSQVLAYLTQAKFGPAGIQFLHALSIALAAGGLLWRFARVTRGFWVPVAGFALFVALNWEQMAVTRPQLAGIACYVALLVLLTVAGPPRIGGRFRCCSSSGPTCTGRSSWGWALWCVRWRDGRRTCGSRDGE